MTSIAIFAENSESLTGNMKVAELKRMTLSTKVLLLCSSSGIGMNDETMADAGEL